MKILNKKKILFLYAEVMSYTIAMLEKLVENNCEVHVIHWDKKTITPFEIKSLRPIYFYSISDYDNTSLLNLSKKIDPDILVVSGWMELIYLRIAFYFKKNNKKVVCMLDDQWYGTFKQQLAKFISPIRPLHFIFTHAWISGFYQFQFAINIGFKKNSIIPNLLTANTYYFQSQYDLNKFSKKDNYPKQFLYVGRLEPVKGIYLLLNSWNEFQKKQNNWKLKLVGSGSLYQYLQNIPNITLSPFLQPEEFSSIIKESGCLIMPSIKEPWGVVLHEFISAGLPVVASDSIGSVPYFLINNYNGLIFKSGDHVDLFNKMNHISNLSDEQLNLLSSNSNKLSNIITPEMSGHSLLSIL
jgi:glycosyltransferase involved in cell wall biosynthesis